MLRPVLLAALLALAPLRAASAEEEHVSRRGDIKVIHAWSRATDGDDGVVFMEIASLGAADRLTGATTARARRVEVHGAMLAAGEASSRPMDGLEIPAGGAFVLEPGAVFLKLIALREPLTAGDDFALRLTFARAGEVDVEVGVEAADATRHGHAGHAH